MQVEFANVALPAYNLQAGMFIAGRFNLYALQADVTFKMNTDGLRLQASLDFSAVRPIWHVL